MLKVRIHKSWKDHLSDKQMSTVRDVINWAIDYHNLRDKEHAVDFIFTDNIAPSLQKGGIVAGRFSLMSSNCSTITINSNINMYSTIRTIFHEVTHLKQNLCYDICYTKYGKSWRGTPYSVTDKKDFDTYWNLPDEIDARNYERKMTYEWYWKKIMSKILFWRKNV